MTDKFLNDADLSKVIGTGDRIGPAITLELMQDPPSKRVRVYAYLSSGPSAGQIVAIRSEFDAGRYYDHAQAYWTSDPNWHKHFIRKGY